MLDVSPVSELRVVKEEAELEGMRSSLKLESAALICYYAKVQEILNKNSHDLYEHECPSILDKIRKEIA